MSEYQLELKQIVDYPRCRIYRQFIQLLIRDRNIRVSVGSGLFSYIVLSCYANFRMSYRRLEGINYTIFPGEWLCRISDLSKWFRTRYNRQALSILKDLKDRNLITYQILGHGKIVKYKIINWCKFNRVLDYNAPCQKDDGFFFLPITIAAEIVSTRRCSEMDIILDLWINTIYNDNSVKGSETGPVVYFRNGSGNPLTQYSRLAERWGLSKSTVCRYLHKLHDLEYISVITFPGTHGTVIYLRNYLSTMFQISDVMLDKEEISMALNININLPDNPDSALESLNSDASVSQKNSVSKLYIDIIIKKIQETLAAQAFTCFLCSKFSYKLLPLSNDCKEVIYNSKNIMVLNFLLKLYCKHTEIANFEISIYPIEQETIL